MNTKTITNIYQVIDERDIDEILRANTNKLVVMMFSMIGCSSCKEMKPLFVNMSKQHTESIFIYVCINKFNETDKKYTNWVQYYPSFSYYFKLNEISRFTGGDFNKLIQTFSYLKIEINKNIQLNSPQQIYQQPQIQQIQQPSPQIQQPSSQIQQPHQQPQPQQPQQIKQQPAVQHPLKVPQVLHQSQQIYQAQQLPVQSNIASQDQQLPVQSNIASQDQQNQELITKNNKIQEIQELQKLKYMVQMQQLFQLQRLQKIQKTKQEEIEK
jgi:hypothetical protein